MKFFLFVSFIALSLTTNAGKMKELMMEAGDAINYEMYKNADLSVENIRNHKLGSVDGLVTVSADVMTRGPHSGRIGFWTCVVFFQIQNQVAEFKDIECH